MICRQRILSNCRGNQGLEKRLKGHESLSHGVYVKEAFMVDVLYGRN